MRRLALLFLTILCAVAAIVWQLSRVKPAAVDPQERIEILRARGKLSGAQADAERAKLR